MVQLGPKWRIRPHRRFAWTEGGLTPGSLFAMLVLCSAQRLNQSARSGVMTHFRRRKALWDT